SDLVYVLLCLPSARARPQSPLPPSTPLFRSTVCPCVNAPVGRTTSATVSPFASVLGSAAPSPGSGTNHRSTTAPSVTEAPGSGTDRKSTRLNSSHVKISYAVFCLQKKKRIRL